MASVGERLRHERETRKMTVDEMAAATGIGRSYLEALERDEIRELPGKAFGKLYIRAYAEVLEFDPQPWIDDYDREQRLAQGASTEPAAPTPAGSRPVAAAIARWKETRAAADRVEPAQESPSEAPAVTTEVTPSVPAAVNGVIPETYVRVSTARRLAAPLLLLGAVAMAAAIYFGMRGTAGDESPAPASAEPAGVEPAQESRRPEPPPPVIVEPRTSPPTKERAARPARAPGVLTVTEFGVGRRIVNLRLEGESDRFAPSDRVYFASRVVGGQRGDVVRHLWIYEGRVQQTITLRLGGPDFRTHSNKTLGHAGEWAVEARDAKGRVLARSTFTCGPAA